MEMNLGYTGTPGQPSVKFWPIYLCFVVFGILIPFSKPEFNLTTFLISVLISLIIGLLMVNMLVMLLNGSNKELRAATGGQFAREAVGTGMLFLIPFTVLAILALLLLGWNAVMPFVSAAIMTASATAGTEAVKKGAQGMKNVMIPSAVAFLFSTGWMIIIGLLP
ncbi:MAG: hypothetical protein PHD40_00985 [Syntrophomonadaceae bacterium]|nr:hypothetical protein [Syntrophomonadaceae bacterium]